MKSQKNNMWMKILSVVIAVLIWLFVANTNDPVVTKRFYSIPVKVMNEDALTKRGYAYEILDGEEVNITVKGKSSIVRSMGISDFQAIADFSKLSKVDAVPIDVTAKKYSDQLDITLGTTNTMKIKKDEVVTISVPVNVTAKGDPAEGYAVGRVTSTPNLIKVSGPENLLSSAKEIRATVSVDGISHDVTATDKPVLYDEEGKKINADLFSWTYTSENCSVIPAAINTVIMAGISLLLAVPVGIGSAIYLVEYAKKGNKLVKVIRVTAETLTGIPSIVYGLFGMLFFVTALKWKFSILAGAFTLAIMILPVILRTTEEALLSVPDSYREGSFGLGAGKLRTIFKIVLPAAVPGILSGVILATGRIVGETAALIYTAGTVAKIPNSAFSSGRTLAVHMYLLANEGLHVNQAYATAVILLILVIAINALSSFIAKKITKAQ